MGDRHIKFHGDETTSRPESCVVRGPGPGGRAGAAVRARRPGREHADAASRGRGLQLIHGSTGPMPTVLPARCRPGDLGPDATAVPTAAPPDGDGSGANGAAWQECSWPAVGRSGALRRPAKLDYGSEAQKRCQLQVPR